MAASDSYPPTIGEYVRLDWTMDALCYDCTGTDKFQIHMGAALNRYGLGCPTREFMLGLVCKCGRKLSLYCFSPEERAPVPIQRR